MEEEKKKRRLPMKIEPGMMFGRLKVMYKCDYQYHSPGGSVANLWHCQYQYENKTELDVLTSSLTSGNTRSCGCLGPETTKRIMKSNKYGCKNKNIRKNGINQYDLSGEYGIGWTSNTNFEFWFDLEDYDKIKNYLWFSKTNGTSKHTYIVAKDSKGNYIYLHRFVMGLDIWKNDKREVDHVFHNTFDNRKKNLRVCKHFQNTASQVTRSDNTSGKKGVHWRKERNKWSASITYNKKTYSLGCYEKFEDAVAAREAAEKKLFGQFSFDDATYDTTLEDKNKENFS